MSAEVWSGTGWDGSGPTLAVVLLDGEEFTGRIDDLDRGCNRHRFDAATAAAKGVEAFARFLCEPFVGWRKWDPKRPPRACEPLLILNSDGDLGIDDLGFDGSSWHQQWTWADESAFRWRYASEILPQ